MNLKDKAIFFRNLAIMLKSGLTITEALDILTDEASGRLKKTLNTILASVASGNSLASSYERFPRLFSPFLTNVVRAGESSGNLENNLENIAERLTREQELSAKIRGAMLYPVIVLTLSFVLGLGLAFFILPKITPIFKGLKVDLPASTRFLIWFSGLVEKHGFVLLAARAAVIVFSVWLCSRKFFKPILHFFFLHIPVVDRISRHKNMSQFSHTLGTLLKSGLPVTEALAITGDTMENYYYKKSVAGIRREISRGTSISESLAKFPEYYPKMAISMIRVGEKSGRLEDELFNLAKIYGEEVENAGKNLANAVEPVLLIIIGAVVGGLALSIITPIYKITGNVYR